MNALFFSTRKVLGIATLLSCVACVTAQSGGPGASPSNGLMSRPSSFDVPQTVEKIETTAKARGLTVFAKIDHAEAAKAAGLQMPPTVLLIVGNPKGGTPAMLAAPSLAIDLPLKILIAQGSDNKTVVTINDGPYLKERHKVPDEPAKALNALSALIDAALTVPK
jgi:uncharacterized protein (DUF302 family)